MAKGTSPSELSRRARATRTNIDTFETLQEWILGKDEEIHIYIPDHSVEIYITQEEYNNGQKAIHLEIKGIWETEEGRLKKVYD